VSTGTPPDGPPDSSLSDDLARGWVQAGLWDGGPGWREKLDTLAMRTPPPKLTASAVDPGLTFTELPEADAVARRLAGEGLSPADVRYRLGVIEATWRRLGYKPPGRWTAEEIAGLLALSDPSARPDLALAAHAVWQVAATLFARAQLARFAALVFGKDDPSPLPLGEG
jgi:hypothetical protein